MRINNLNYLKERRRELRNNPTKYEELLWKRLANKKLNGIKFRRQHSLNHYIVDFYCATYKLIIEVDGEIHNQPENHNNDRMRDRELAELGYNTIRFTNRQVEFEIENVIEVIQNYIASRV
ncbi:MAG: endonuclease domain-containing protein [Roseivirga sp.]|jgi:very-short-patch-repair endonuclease|uniref:endonuclease domain-containing protein n=1 Tax=Roseivirga sp. TaxID=1964215 RepID=UPI001B2A3FD1|nr:endonuclease domain-containing protein [Roseivirga sp.]MBO6494411.1 endonuclease domain-containing protein [Roseivirga sp.]